MKRHPQFNEPQACRFSVFFYIRECYEKENSFLYFMDLGEKSIMSEKEHIFFNLRI